MYIAQTEYIENMTARFRLVGGEYYGATRDYMGELTYGKYTSCDPQYGLSYSHLQKRNSELSCNTQTEHMENITARFRLIGGGEYYRAARG